MEMPKGRGIERCFRARYPLPLLGPRIAHPEAVRVISHPSSTVQDLSARRSPHARTFDDVPRRIERAPEHTVEYCPNPERAVRLLSLRAASDPTAEPR